MTPLIEFLRLNSGGSDALFEDIRKLNPQVSQNTILEFSSHREHFHQYDCKCHIASLYLHAGELIYAYVSTLDVIVIYRPPENKE
jgi:hypothetical protein